jgi:hypothetical protein
MRGVNGFYEYFVDTFGYLWLLLGVVCGVCFRYGILDGACWYSNFGIWQGIGI